MGLGASQDGSFSSSTTLFNFGVIHFSSDTELAAFDLDALHSVADARAALAAL
jgi:hypothetical protein